MVNIMTAVFTDLEWFNLVYIYVHLGELSAVSSILIMEATSSPEMLVFIYKTSPRQILQDHSLNVCFAKTIYGVKFQ
jgi:hypothetical protein